MTEIANHRYITAGSHWAKAKVKAILFSDGFLEILNDLFVLSGDNDKKKIEGCLGSIQTQDL